MGKDRWGVTPNVVVLIIVESRSLLIRWAIFKFAPTTNNGCRLFILGYKEDFVVLSAQNVFDLIRETITED